VDAVEQRAREGALLRAARGGAAAHLHVSALAGEVLSLGAFHREPRGVETLARWRRRTGGRAAAAGEGFRVITLALPHRAALVAASAEALRPEQSLNRGVRGVLAALARLGIDALYPGLDAVTVGGRTVAQLGLAEHPEGGALFQAVLAWDDSFARTPVLLDRADPEGLVPMALAAASSFTSVRELRGAAAAAVDVGSFAAAVGDGYREAFGAGVRAVAPAPAADEDAASGPLPGVEPGAGAGVATRPGRIGPVSAWLLRDREGDRIADAGVSGDLIAPQALPSELGRHLAGIAASGPAIADALAGWLDGRERYLLGVREAELVELLVAAAASDRAGGRLAAE
jgi:hypothetical protein